MELKISTLVGAAILQNVNKMDEATQGGGGGGVEGGEGGGKGGTFSSLSINSYKPNKNSSQVYHVT